MYLYNGDMDTYVLHPYTGTVHTYVSRSVTFINNKYNMYIHACVYMYTHICVNEYSACTHIYIYMPSTGILKCRTELSIVCKPTSPAEPTAKLFRGSRSPEKLVETPAKPIRSHQSPFGARSRPIRDSRPELFKVAINTHRNPMVFYATLWFSYG